MGDFGCNFTSKGKSEVEIHHVRKYTKLRWDCGGIEIVVSEVESLEMAKRENGAIGMEETFKATTTEVDSNDVTYHHIIGDHIPPTTIYTHFPWILWRIRIINTPIIRKINRKEFLKWYKAKLWSERQRGVDELKEKEKRDELGRERNRKKMRKKSTWWVASKNTIFALALRYEKEEGYMYFGCYNSELRWHRHLYL